METMREIGGGITVAAVATVLTSHSRTLLAARTSDADLTAATHAFHSAYWVVVATPSPGPDRHDGPVGSRIHQRPRECANRPFLLWGHLAGASGDRCRSDPASPPRGGWNLTPSRAKKNPPSCC